MLITGKILSVFSRVISLCVLLATACTGAEQKANLTDEASIADDEASIAEAIAASAKDVAAKKEILRMYPLFAKMQYLAELSYEGQIPSELLEIPANRLNIYLRDTYNIESAYTHENNHIHTHTKYFVGTPILSSRLQQPGGKNDGLIYVAIDGEGVLEINIAFQGTSENLDWADNLQAQKSLINSDAQNPDFPGINGEVHGGFLSRFMRLKDQIDKNIAHALEAVKTRGKVIRSIRVNLTGHSLGGALATIAALYCKANIGKLFGNSNENIHVHLITFSSPRVFSGKDEHSLNDQRSLAGTTADAISSFLAPNAYRIWKRYDLVTAMPSGKLGFKHVGKSTPYDDKQPFKERITQLLINNPLNPKAVAESIVLRNHDIKQFKMIFERSELPVDHTHLEIELRELSDNLLGSMLGICQSLKANTIECLDAARCYTGKAKDATLGYLSGVCASLLPDSSAAQKYEQQPASGAAQKYEAKLFELISFDSTDKWEDAYKLSSYITKNLARSYSSKESKQRFVDRIRQENLGKNRIADNVIRILGKQDRTEIDTEVERFFTNINSRCADLIEGKAINKMRFELIQEMIKNLQNEMTPQQKQEVCGYLEGLIYRYKEINNEYITRLLRYVIAKFELQSNPCQGSSCVSSVEVGDYYRSSGTSIARTGGGSPSNRENKQPSNTDGNYGQASDKLPNTPKTIAPVILIADKEQDKKRLLELCELGSTTKDDYAYEAAYNLSAYIAKNLRTSFLTSEEQRSYMDRIQKFPKTNNISNNVLRLFLLSEKEMTSVADECARLKHEIHLYCSKMKLNGTEIELIQQMVRYLKTKLTQEKIQVLCDYLKQKSCLGVRDLTAAICNEFNR